MSNTCKSCGAVDSMKPDLVGTDHFLVCFQCGALEDAPDRLTSDLNFGDSGNSFQADGLALAIGRDGGLSKVRNKSSSKKRKIIAEAVGRLALADVIKVRALEIMDAFHSRIGKMTSTANVAYACLFIACQQNGASMTIKEFCQKLDLSLSHTVRTKESVLKRLGGKSGDVDVNLETLVARRLAELELPVSLEKKLVSLVHLSRKGWVTSGKSDELSLWPCLHLLLRSGKTSSKCPRTFFEDRRIQKHVSYSTFSQHVRQLNGFLKRLSQEVPWLPRHLKGSSEGVDRALDWMLTNVGFFEGFIEDANQSSDKDDAEPRSFAPPSFKRRPSGEDVKTEQASSPKRVRVADGVELGEEDIPEAELHLFIRSPDEISRIERVKEELERCGGGGLV